MYNESWLCNYLDGCRKYTNEILHLDYVKDIKEVMFNSTKTERENIRARYSAKVPDALTNQFPDRRKKRKLLYIMLRGGKPEQNSSQQVFLCNFK